MTEQYLEANPDDKENVETLKKLMKDQVRRISLAWVVTKIESQNSALHGFLWNQVSILLVVPIIQVLQCNPANALYKNVF